MNNVTKSERTHLYELCAQNPQAAKSHAEQQLRIIQHIMDQTRPLDNAPDQLDLNKYKRALIRVINEPHYVGLKHLVRIGKVEFIYIMALPRTCGTALHQALAQADEVSGQINEPACYDDVRGRRYDFKPSPTDKLRTFDTVCQRIFSCYNPASTHMKFVIHDISVFATTEEVMKMNKLTRNTICVIRSPLNMAISQFTRIINDRLAQPGGDVLSSNEVFYLMSPHFEGIEPQGKIDFVMSRPQLVKRIRDFHSKKEGEPVTAEEIDAARKSAVEYAQEQYCFAWDNLFEFFKFYKRAQNQRLVVFNGDLLQKPNVDHHATLKELVSHFPSITYKPDMVNNWVKGVKERFVCFVSKIVGKNSAWNRSSHSNTCLTSEHSTVLKNPRHLGEFPLEMQKVIRERFSIFNQIKDYKP